VIGAANRVHSRKGDDLGVCHVPQPVGSGTCSSWATAELLPLRVIDVVETGPHSPPLVKVAVPALVR
jgi:hypothetical protein